MEQSFHPPLAAAERAALRSARSSARADGSSGSAGCGAELFLRERRERGRAPALPLPPTTDNRQPTTDLFLTPMATSRRGTAAQPYRVF